MASPDVEAVFAEEYYPPWMRQRILKVGRPVCRHLISLPRRIDVRLHRTVERAYVIRVRRPRRLSPAAGVPRPTVQQADATRTQRRRWSLRPVPEYTGTGRPLTPRFTVAEVKKNRW